MQVFNVLIDMKRSFYFIPFLLFFPLFAAAAVSHTRSSSESPVPSSRIVVTIAASDYDTDINCGGLAFWGIQVIEQKTGNRFSGNPRFVSSAVLSQTFTIDVLPGDYEEVTFICSGNGENEAFQFGSIENNFAVSTRQNPSNDSVKTSPQTPAVPSLIKSISDFLGVGVSAETTSPETPATETASSTITIVDVVPATASPEVATTTQEIITPSEVATTISETITPSEGVTAAPEALPSPEEATTPETVSAPFSEEVITQTALENSSLAAAVGVLDLNIDVPLTIILIIDILILAPLFQRLMQWYQAKKSGEI